VPTVLCDSGPLIALAKVGRLRLLLDLWDTVHVTEQVYQEAVAFGHALGAPDALTIRLFWQKHRLPILSVSDDVLTAYKPASTLDPGERATFAHAMALKEVLVLVDDEARHSRSAGRGPPACTAYTS